MYKQSTCLIITREPSFKYPAVRQKVDFVSLSGSKEHAFSIHAHCNWSIGEMICRPSEGVLTTIIVSKASEMPATVGDFRKLQWYHGTATQTKPSYSESADTMVSSRLLPSLNSAISRLPFSSLSIIRKIFLTRFSGVSSSSGSLTMDPTCGAAINQPMSPVCQWMLTILYMASTICSISS